MRIGCQCRFYLNREVSCCSKQSCSTGTTESTTREEPEGNPVVLAAKFHNRKCLELLLQHGFNPSIPNPDGETALWWAINNGRTDMCRLLLEHGADPDLTPEGAVPPLIESVFANSLDMMKLLVDHTANIEKKEMPGKGWRRTPCLS